MNSTAARHAGVAAEAIRVLNHATLPGRCDLGEPADAYDVPAHLATIVDRLGQAIGQVQRHLDQQATAGRVRVVDGEYQGHPHAAVGACRDLTHQAAATAAALGGLLHAAQEVVTWVAATPAENNRNRDPLLLIRNDPGHRPRTR